MTEIRAGVSRRILKTVPHMFPGDAKSRITELLQNARRAGATEVHITQELIFDGQCRTLFVDNGKGVRDFTSLLHAGRTDWDKKTLVSEEPAGMGVFCLAPRKVEIRSLDKRAVIEGNQWVGAPVTVEEGLREVSGTHVIFEDEPWLYQLVTSLTKYCDMDVYFNGKRLPRTSFLGLGETIHDRELGVEFSIAKRHSVDATFGERYRSYRDSGIVFFNFYGQVIGALLRDILPKEAVYFNFDVKVNLTGEPTDLCMVLPSRSGVAHNPALKKLGERIEYEWYRQVRDSSNNHCLPYACYRRGIDVGVNIASSKPHLERPFFVENRFMTYNPPWEGDELLVWDHNNILVDGEEMDDDSDCLVYVLYSVGMRPGIIPHNQRGYPWVSEVPQTSLVSVDIGNVVLSSHFLGHNIEIVDEIKCDIRATDGRTWSISLPCFAFNSDELICSKEYLEDGLGLLLLDLCGAEFEDDTGYQNFEEEVERLQNELRGPGEHLRILLARLAKDIARVAHLSDTWTDVTIYRDGSVYVGADTGISSTFRPPKS